MYQIPKNSLKKDGTVTIHQRNLRTLAIEMYKISNDFSPIFIKDIVTESGIPYNTRSTAKMEKDTNGDLTLFHPGYFWSL